MNCLLDNSWLFREGQFDDLDFFADFYGTYEWQEFENRFANICRVRNSMNKNNWNGENSEETWLEWLNKFGDEKYFSYHKGVTLGMLGRTDEALELLKNVIHNKYLGLTPEMFNSWRFKNLKNIPEWQEILKVKN